MSEQPLLTDWFNYAIQMAQYPNNKVRPAIQANAQKFQAKAKLPAEAKYEMEPPPPPLKDEHPDATYDTSGRKMS